MSKDVHSWGWMSWDINLWGTSIPFTPAIYETFQCELSLLAGSGTGTQEMEVAVVVNLATRGAALDGQVSNVGLCTHIFMPPEYQNLHVCDGVVEWVFSELKGLSESKHIEPTRYCRCKYCCFCSFSPNIFINSTGKGLKSYEKSSTCSCILQYYVWILVFVTLRLQSLS